MAWHVAHAARCLPCMYVHARARLERTCMPSSIIACMHASIYAHLVRIFHTRAARHIHISASWHAMKQQQRCRSSSMPRALHECVLPDMRQALGQARRANRLPACRYRCGRCHSYALQGAARLSNRPLRYHQALHLCPPHWQRSRLRSRSSSRRRSRTTATSRSP